MKILIGGAWPYANGSLHIGHLASLLPGDVLARYHRAVGDEVYYVSGSDCHGTPVAIRARQENKTPEAVSDYYHDEFCECFQKLGFSFDLYGKTSSEEHKAFVTDFHRRLYESGYVYEKTSPQAYCENCGIALADRFVTGGCPSCGEKVRGDQCDACSCVPEPEALLSPACAFCGAAPVFKETKHLYIALTRLEDRLKAYIAAHPEWRKNAVAFSNRYLNEGLRDRAITRYLDWGIDVPRDGYEDKKIYIWAENVLGYLSASKQVCEARGASFDALWGCDVSHCDAGHRNAGHCDARHYYVHGKDNIPFHTIILPSLLLANPPTAGDSPANAPHGGTWHLPDVMVSSEHLTLEGRKISTSQNWAIWVKDSVGRYDPDSLRYFLIANGPEKRDADFSWREYINSHNGELLGAYGNFVNRSLAFITRFFGGSLPDGTLRPDIEAQIKALYPAVGGLITQCRFKDALETIFSFIRDANKYFDTERPWETRVTDPAACDNTLYTCVQIISNLAVLLRPFLPFSSEKILSWLQLKPDWVPQFVRAGFRIPEPEILFERIDKSVLENELRKLR
jgi:methionyl-tRNA synthetase